MRLTFPFRQVLLGGPYNGAIIPTERWPEPEMVLTRPIDWCVCPDGTVTETSYEIDVYRLERLTGNDARRVATYVCEGWKACRCGRYIPEQEPECSRCQRSDQELVSA